MKKIVPFNNVLTFDTDVCEITAISLEHKIANEDNMISGEFYISGEYKITDGQLERDKFNFELPFDIALGSNYDRNTLVIDIDDFRYEIIDRNKLKVNIDLYIDGEIIPDEEMKLDNEMDKWTDEINTIDIKQELVIDEPSGDKYNEMLRKETSTDKSNIDDFDREEMTITNREEKKSDKRETILDREKKTNTLINKEEEYMKEKTMLDKETEEGTDRIDLFEEMADWQDKEDNEVIINNNINNNKNENNEENKINIFGGFNSEDKYATYRVYRVVEGDTIDKIIGKYNTSKDELAKYNNIVEIKIGDKLIIPANDK